jgi:gamma-glutamyltranspeptidase/glutathione hydrolase
MRRTNDNRPADKRMVNGETKPGTRPRGWFWHLLPAFALAWVAVWGSAFGGWNLTGAAVAAEVSTPEILLAQATTGADEDTGFATDETRKPVVAKRQMVVAANPIAAAIGRDILRRGGSAVDAAIAVQIALTLVEPQSSGIGGGAFMLAYNAHDDKVTSYDGRETAPAAAGGNLFLTADGKPKPREQARFGGPAVGVPGVVSMLELAHHEHGLLSWAALFEPTIALAEKGFEISQRLHDSIANDPSLKKYPHARAYFYDAEGKPLPVGTRLRNPALAAVLRSIADEGAEAFYTGDIARDIAAAVHDADNPGLMTASDLAGYQAKERDPICGPYRLYTICGMGPPSSGGIAVLQTLSLIQRFDMGLMEPMSAEAVHLIVEAERLAYADRDAYVADSDFVSVPVEGLINRNYLNGRSTAISRNRSMGVAKPGKPPSKHTSLEAPMVQDEHPSTSHISIVDDEGNAVAMTTSVGYAFGSRLFVHGFFLNNELTDFSMLPANHGHQVANRVQGGKRPRSSMSPTLVFDADGKLILAIGSPGGADIIGFVVEALVAVLDWKLDVQQAVSLPHFLNRNGPTELEKGTRVTTLRKVLEEKGHQIKIDTMTSGLHGIQIKDGKLFGGADPRREGVALGD